MHSVEVTPDTEFLSSFFFCPKENQYKMKVTWEENPGPWLSEPILFQPSLYIKLKACSKPKLSRQSHCRSSRTKYSPLSRPSQEKASLFLPAGDSLQSGWSHLLIYLNFYLNLILLITWRKMQANSLHYSVYWYQFPHFRQWIGAVHYLI